MQWEKMRNAATIIGIAAINNEKFSYKYCGMQQWKMGLAARKNEECSDNNGNSSNK